MVQKIRTKKQWLWEFSKRVVVGVALVYLAEIVFADIFMCLYPENETIGVIIEHISDVFKATVVAYAIKAGFENCIRIKDHYREE